MADPFELIAGQIAREQGRQSFWATDSANPDAIGKANRLGRQLGVPAALVDSDLTGMENRARLRQAERLLDRYPAIGSWAANARNAALARDDLDSLERNARYWSRAVSGEIRATPAPSPTLGNMITGIGQSIATWVPSLRALGEDLLPDWIKAPAPRNTAVPGLALRSGQTMRDAQRALARSNAAQPEFKSWWAGDLYGGVSSLVQMTPGIALSVATRSAALAVTMAGLQSGAPAYVKYRGRGGTKGEAAAGAAIEGGAEALGELLPMGYVVGSLGRKGFGSFLSGYLGRELPSEVLTTVVQQAADTAVANPDKTWGQFFADLPANVRQTVVGTAVSAGFFSGLNEAARRIEPRLAEESRAADQAAAVDAIFEAAAENKVRQRDPDAFASLADLHLRNSGAENVYVPAEALSRYFQSNDIDYREDDFWGDYSGQIEEAFATGGDVIVPTSQAAAKLAGTPAWDAIRPDVRLSPGGVSMSEAEAFDASKETELARMGEEMAAQFEADRAAMAPREKIFESVRDRLMEAGYTPDAATVNAELAASRYATRAARLGRDLVGDEADTLEIRQVLPEGLAPAVAADQLDLVIAAMKGGKEAKPKLGPSLLEWISAQGGVEDPGGDLSSMGAADWHKGKPGKRKLLRPAEARGQAAMFGGAARANTLDDIAMRAWEAGYFPEFTERPTVNDLLDAMGEGLRGTDRFAQEDTSATLDVRQAADDLRSLLESRGIDSQTADPRTIREEVRKFQAERTGDALQQTFADGPRGQISFQNGRAIIELFESRDLSTFVHEMGHDWLEQLREDATGPDAPEQLQADWQAVQDWFAANGHPVVDGVIPVDAHELWARGIERFVMEGKAPSSTLRRVFETFRAWLLQIYTVVDNLRAPITPEVRDVMERLVATDEEIAAARERQAIAALFKSAEEAGMTEAEFADYQRATSEARDTAFEALLYRTMQTIRQARTKAWKEEERGIRADVTTRVNRRPEFKALHLLRTGKFLDNPEAEAIRVKLDTGWLVETYGEDVLGTLPKGVPPIFSHERSTDADTIAQMVGFRTGDELVRTLIGLEQRQREMRDAGDKRSIRQRLIDEEALAEMRDRHGDPLNDGSIEEEALAAVMNERQGEVIASELRTLQRRRRDGRPPTPYSVAREWAARTIREGKVHDVASRAAIQRYSRAAAKASREAEAAMLKGDVDETFRQKQRQMLNTALVAEAKKAAEAIETAVSRLGKIANRATMKSIDQAYLDQAHALLEQIEFRPRSQASLNRQASFAEWARQRQAEGHDVVVPDSFAESLGTTHWSRLSVEKLLGLDDTVKQIIHLGRLKQKLIDTREEREFAEVIDEAVAQAGQLPPRPPSDVMDPGFVDRMKANVAGFDAALLKIETLVDWLDQGNSDGVFNRIVFAPVAEAQTREQDMFRDYAGRLQDALAEVGAKRLRRWSEQVTVPELLNRETGNPWTFSRQQLVSMALNMGNAGNAQRLADGYGWDESAILAVLDRELAPEDWAYVQKVWDIIDGLWPEIEGLEKRINGIAPEKVQARPLETSAGTLRGGYFPVVYDTTRDYRAEANATRESDLFEAKYTRATTVANATKERLEKVSRPVLLDLGVITRHVGEVIHDITHREAVMNVDKFITHPRIMKAIDDTLGSAARKQFRPWLKFVANQWAIERAGNEGVGKFLNKLRANATVVGMGFRFSTMMMQVAGYSNSAEVVGAGWLAQAITQTAASPIETFNFVAERSGEIRNRMDTLDRDIAAGVRRLAGQSNPLTEVQRFAFHGIGYMDRLVVVPTWMAGYSKALSEGLTEEQAIYAADKAVRQSQGAAGAKDIAAVARGQGQWGQALKLMTMFYSYLSAVYQRQRTLGRDVASAAPRDLPGLMARAWWLVVVPPLLSELLAGRGPGEEEDWGWWSFKQMLLQSLGAIPLVRDVARPAWEALAGGRPFDYQLSPMQRVGQVVVDSAKDAGRIARGEETKRATRNTLETVGYWTGLVPGQVATATQFLVDVGYGEQDPQTVGDWFEGLTKGKVKED